MEKEIKGYENLYTITSCGKVFSLGNGNSTNGKTKVKKQLKPRTKSNGYLQVKLFKNNVRKYYLVHRLVAMQYIENINNKPQVNHIDCNKQNNKVENLEWCTSKENITHSVINGLQVNKKGIHNTCSKQVVQKTLEGNIVKVWGSINEACKALGFNSFGIIKCCKKEKKYNTAYKQKWEYVN